ncbi:monooxygenase [Gordonia spumicola]|uniref:Monooxygenase n=1 Tax=Gordonia spumicola TaxID=589161 RepID=A0A7I9VG91_9ACTN|nr:NAD(P)/FAD-dependent oxidoreductase [Gordonia spumicola]GED99564.1 monooxygenase [Gordonia spumicola]GEE04106.1 monooxygenase [Gordonia spumicola]GEE04121.1 monooxygenase [Gordonia spumicola]
MTSDNTLDLDVVIVGAGISGIAAAVALGQNCPDKSYAVLEARASIGGTWDLFRYPGIRSDSDMYTLGYSFRPWLRPEAIAAGGAIREYLVDTAAEFGVDKHIRFSSRLTEASWNSELNRWTLVVDSPVGEDVIRCRHLFLGSGYYSYRGGFEPTIDGEDTFDGPMLHAQNWPDDLDHRGKRVAVIGSGATAITLVPNLARDAANVTMVQRSPTYIHIETGDDPEADELRRTVGPEETFRRIRLRNLRNQQEVYAQAKGDPDAFKATLFDAIDAQIGEDVRKQHFTPTYEPWNQRICVVPDSDLFHAVRDGRADVVTGSIDRITPTGLTMADGTRVEADIIVKATGLDVVLGGEAEFDVDGWPVEIGREWTYKGAAISGVPNLVYAFGFINASWTLRIEALTDYWCRVLIHMDDIGAEKMVADLTDGEQPALPFISGVDSGYLRRAEGLLPRQGDAAPWINPQNYADTLDLFASVDDGVLTFS